MVQTATKSNLEVYDQPAIAAHYAALDYLTPCERLLFATYIPNGSAVLELGVGGGRITGYLTKRATRYVGVDYAPAMVKECKARFPEAEVLVGNASDLSNFCDGSFHAVVFAFNGIDYVPAATRKNCFAEIRRVLKPGAVFIFSSHNPRAVLVRMPWNRQRLRAIAQRVTPNVRPVQLFVLFLLILARGAWAGLQSAWGTLKRLIARVPSFMFRNGEGEMLDPVHGGLLTHYAAPDKIVAELGNQFRPVRVLGDDYPRRSHLYATDWYYYVFSKPDEK